MLFVPAATSRPPRGTRRDGATIPALSIFQSVLGLQATPFGWGLGDHIHAPNERFKVGSCVLARCAPGCALTAACGPLLAPARPPTACAASPCRMQTSMWYKGRIAWALLLHKVAHMHDPPPAQPPKPDKQADAEAFMEKIKDEL